MKTYDFELHVTAGELRALGADVSAEVPDCAYVPRASIRVGEATEEPSDDPNVLALSLPIDLDEPFRWVEVKLTLPRYGTPGA